MAKPTYSYDDLYRMLHFSISSSNIPGMQASINKCTKEERTHLKEIRDKKSNQEYKDKMFWSTQGNESAIKSCQQNLQALNELKFNVEKPNCTELLYPNDDPGKITITEVIL